MWLQRFPKQTATKEMLEESKDRRNKLGRGQSAQLDGYKISRYIHLPPIEQGDLIGKRCILSNRWKYLGVDTQEPFIKMVSY